MELVDVVDSKSTAGDSVPVRVRSPAPSSASVPRNTGRSQYYPGVAQLVARLLWEQDAAGSNPVTRTIKETSFVYQDKRGFFLLSGQNTGQIIEKRASERSIGYSEARFLRSAAKENRNRCCTNRISLLCKQLLNVFRVWDLNRMFAKNPVQVMI